MDSASARCREKSPFTSYVSGDVTSHPFLEGMAEAHLGTIARLAEPVQFHEHELILSTEQLSKHFYLVQSGSVLIELQRLHFAVRIQTLGPGDAFGWSALLEQHDSLFDVRARERCTVLRLNGPLLRSALRSDPLLAADLFRRALNLVAGRVQATEVRLGELCGVRMIARKREAARATEPVDLILARENGTSLSNGGTLTGSAFNPRTGALD